MSTLRTSALLATSVWLDLDKSAAGASAQCGADLMICWLCRYGMQLRQLHAALLELLNNAFVQPFGHGRNLMLCQPDEPDTFSI
jgi:hypothetical protein